MPLFASELTGGKFANGALSAALVSAIQIGRSPQHLKPDGSPDDATEDFIVKDAGWDLKVEDGVLTGEITYGCRNDVYSCHEAAKMMMTINESEKVNITFKWVRRNADITFFRHERWRTTVSGGEVQARYIKLDRRLFGFGGPRGRIETTRVNKVDQRVILHELGHALGVSHQYNHTNSVMSYSPNGRSNFSSSEIDKIIEAYK